MGYRWWVKVIFSRGRSIYGAMGTYAKVYRTFFITHVPSANEATKEITLLLILDEHGSVRI